MSHYRAEAENELAWRIDELNYYSNLLATCKEDNKNKLYRMIITMLYAHYEGYMYFLFNLYVKHINNQDMKCMHVKTPIVAASLAGVFRELRNTSRKPRLLLSNAHSEEIVQVARDTEFIENLGFYLNKPVVIPDKTISSDSNLKMNILKSILFRLGLDHDSLDDLSADITKLVNYRNTIAHGSRNKPISEDEFSNIRDSTISAMERVRNHIYQSIESRAYLISDTIDEEHQIS